MSYMIVSDPPIFADIGDFDFDIENITMILDMNQYFDSDGVMEVIINSLQLDIAPWRMNFNGISDISKVATSFITYVGNVLTNILTSIIAYAGPTNINKIVSKLIEQIPDEKHFPNS
jgi:hypothetical protein